ncbi:MYB transcription factor TaMYB1 [Cinnamomum micranthum f. kanehirae]|uniref:MYB transcription factor TaMYB1 n=1 Tax=Cinnamomum micranthum f. kanehirae TaxID=337451 RepID=A0A443NWV1_9MAGN|nr:MYB transcription factor TaMYB1 [Cinnamomum micranthum f. kanehirae]
MATSQAMTIATGSASAIEEVRGRWRTDEDEKLRRAVKEHGAKNWSVICTYIPGRSAKSCRLRWQNQLSPDVNHSPFTLEEDLEIVRHQSRLGNKWAAIARVLNAGRTENAVKNHWNCRIRKMMSSYSPPYDRRRAYHRYGYRRYHPLPLPSPLVLRSLSRRVISYGSSHPSNGGGEPHGSIDLTLRLAPPGPGLRSSSLPSTREMVSFVVKKEARGYFLELRGNLQTGSNNASEGVMNRMENQAGVGRMN